LGESLAGVKGIIFQDFRFIGDEVFEKNDADNYPRDGAVLIFSDAAVAVC
jgi:hypothetical protein